MAEGIAVLGSTGSVGTQTLEVLQRFSHRYRVVGLAARTDIESLSRQVYCWRPRWIAVTDPLAHERFRRLYPEWRERLLPPGDEGLSALASEADVDVVVNALVGAVGVKPTLTALQAGKRVALANKETLVAAGPLVMEAAARGHGDVPRLLPVDSEHSAIFQCLQGHPRGGVQRLILTASGGPFRGWTASQLEQVTPEQALQHPNWRMGGKITVDSATLMNKGLEVIEAHWLFGVPSEAIDVWVHPQSIVHSLVEFRDGSMLAQLALPDMRLPIQYALSYPQRWPADWPRLDLTRLPGLTFEPPDWERFPCLSLAYRALEVGGTMPAVLNAANEVAVQLFLQGRLAFTGIARLVEQVMEEHGAMEIDSVDTVLEVDRWARRRAQERARPYASLP